MASRSGIPDDPCFHERARLYALPLFRRRRLSASLHGPIESELSNIVFFIRQAGLEAC